MIVSISNSRPSVDASHVFVDVDDVVFWWEKLVEVLDGSKQLCSEQRFSRSSLSLLPDRRKKYKLGLGSPGGVALRGSCTLQIYIYMYMYIPPGCEVVLSI